MLPFFKEYSSRRTKQLSMEIAHKEGLSCTGSNSKTNTEYCHNSDDQRCFRLVARKVLPVSAHLNSVSITTRKEFALVFKKQKMSFHI